MQENPQHRAANGKSKPPSRFFLRSGQQGHFLFCFCQSKSETPQQRHRVRPYRPHATLKTKAILIAMTWSLEIDTGIEKSETSKNIRFKMQGKKVKATLIVIGTQNMKEKQR